MVQMVHSRTTDVQINTISCYTCICTVYECMYLPHVIHATCDKAFVTHN